MKQLQKTSSLSYWKTKWKASAFSQLLSADALLQPSLVVFQGLLGHIM